MASRLLPMKRLMKCERLAIYLLRGGSVPRMNAATLDAFGRLRNRAAQSGFTIALPDNPYLCKDEALLLGWIALLQRQVILPETGIPADLHPLVADCASGLAGAAIRLDFLSVARSTASSTAALSIGGNRFRPTR